MIARPQQDEYAPFYAGYVQRVEEGGDVLALLGEQADGLRRLLAGIDEAGASARPRPDEWSVKEVLGHMCDTERIFAYRALRMARGDTTPLPGFEQDDYVRATDFNRRTLASLLDEFEAQRRGNLLFLEALTAAEIDRRGTASNGPFSVRALIYVMAGHVLHHVESLRVDYQVGK